MRSMEVAKPAVLSATAATVLLSISLNTPVLIPTILSIFLYLQIPSQRFFQHETNEPNDLAANCLACRGAGPGDCDDGRCIFRYGKKRTMKYYEPQMEEYVYERI